MSNHSKSNAGDFCLPKSLSFAWRLRSDVRGKHAIDDIEAQKDFVLWWVVYGRDEYRAVNTLPDTCKAILFEALDDYPVMAGFGVSRVLKYLIQIRSDLSEYADLNTLDGVIKLNSWLFTYGLREHGFNEYLDDKTQQALNRPMTEDIPGISWSSSNADLPKLTPLMFFIWYIREDVQQAFDLNDSLQRERFSAWFFFQAVNEFALGNWITEDWRQWLLEPVVFIDDYSMPRFYHLFWLFREDLQQTFNLKQLDGCQGLVEWMQAHWTTESALQWLYPADIQTSSTIETGVNLIGFAFGELGIGEDVRMAAAACERLGIPYKVINISPGGNVREQDLVLSESIVKDMSELPYAVNVFCLTGFDTARAYLEMGEPLFRGRYNIGWWPWELPVWPEQWLDVFDLVDEVWAATKFTQNMYQKATDKPVTLMPLPVSVDRLQVVSREELGIPEHRFLFLYIFDFNSYLARKNPHAAIQAFLSAFPLGTEPVGLVLKTMNSNPDNPKWRNFKKLCQQDERITLIEKTLDREIVLGLVNACDAYLSLHRSEGFGRTLAEAMLMGKPVIATDFSGNADFIHAPLAYPVRWKKKKVKSGEYPFITQASKAYWAEPDIDQAAEQMQTVVQQFAEPESTRVQAIRGYAEYQFSLQRIGSLMLKRLKEVL